MILAFLLLSSALGLDGNLAVWVPLSAVEIAMVTIECIEELNGFHDNGILHPKLTALDFIYTGFPANVIMETNSPLVETHTGFHHQAAHTIETWEKIYAELENVLSIVRAAVARTSITEPLELLLTLLRLDFHFGDHDIHESLIAIMHRIVPSRVPWISKSFVDPLGVDEYLRELTRTELALCTGPIAARRIPLVVRSNGIRYIRLTRFDKAVRLFSDDQIVLGQRSSAFEANRERLILGRLQSVSGVPRLVEVSPTLDSVVATAGNRSDVDFIHWRCFSEEFLILFTIQVVKLLRNIHDEGFVYGFIQATSFVITDLGDVRIVNFENASTWLDPLNPHTRMADMFDLFTFVYQIDRNGRLAEFHTTCARPQTSWSQRLSNTLYKILDQIMKNNLPLADPKYDEWIAMLENI